MRRMSGGLGGLLRVLSVGASAVVLSCGGDDSTRVPGTSGAGSSEEAPADFVAGVKLAVVSFTSTHSVEFWETRPGSVLMIQKWDASQGEKPLELGPQFREAGGSFGAVYRKLMNDPDAALSPEMAAADERLSHMPIRDASLPRPPSVPPPFPAAALGQSAAPVPAAGPVPAAATVPAAAAPGTVAPLSVVHYGGGIATFVDSSFCTGDPEVDGGWCPPGAYYGFANGNSQEVMFFDSVGHNPQAAGGSSDTYALHRIWSNGTYATDFSYGLSPGHSVEVVYMGTAATYQGTITGQTVSYAEKWRLSFPSLSYAYSAPAWGDSEGTFANDIEGIAHGEHISKTGGPLWFFSRTQFCGYLSPTCNHGQSLHGQVAISGDLGGPSYECTFDGPWSWVSSGYAHFGDIVYEPPLPPLRPGFLLVSLNDKDNHHSGVGFLGVVPTTTGCQEHYKIADWGTAVLSTPSSTGTSPNEQNPALAVTHKYSDSESINSVHVYVPASGAIINGQISSWNYLHEYLIDFSSAPTVVWGKETHIVNGNWALTQVSNPNGMKVSSHGKLYMWGVASESQTGRLYGIDPFTGMIQTQFDLNYGGPGGFTGGIESEGLDIVDTSDVGLTRAAPEILVQILANSLTGTSQWNGAHLSVDDPGRL